MSCHFTPIYNTCYVLSINVPVVIQKNTLVIKGVIYLLLVNPILNINFKVDLVPAFFPCILPFGSHATRIVKRFLLHYCNVTLFAMVNCVPYVVDYRFVSVPRSIALIVRG